MILTPEEMMKKEKADHFGKMLADLKQTQTDAAARFIWEQAFFRRIDKGDGSAEAASFADQAAEQWRMRWDDSCAKETKA